MTKEKSRLKELRSALLLTLTVLSGLFLSEEMGEYVSEGIVLAVTSVVPSSFPFMIISDFYTHYGHPEDLGRIGKAVSRIFGVPLSGLGALICGNVGGFPIGAKMTAELYEGGGIDKRNAERLLPLSSNPSCAFIIGAVGLGMYTSFRIGLVLLASLYLSCVFCAVLTKPTRENIEFNGINIKQSYSFVTSVKSAGVSIISLIAFISCFSVTVGLVKKHVENLYLSAVLIMLLEVTNAAKIFSSGANFPLLISLTFTAFALGFGGLSTFMQSAIFTEKNDLSMRTYICIKLLQGILCAAFLSILYFVFLV